MTIIKVVYHMILYELMPCAEVICVFESMNETICALKCKTSTINDG